MRLGGALLVTILICAASAHAQKKDIPCVHDAQKLCPGVSPGGGRVMDCLRQHQGELSAACKAVVANATPGAPRPAKGAGPRGCQADVEKLCKDVPPGQGRVFECLKSHSDQLSPECKTMLDARARHAAKTPAAAAAAASPAPTAKKK